MKVYPVMLKLAGRRVVIVGGGAVAARKVRLLKEMGAKVTLIADKLLADVDLAEVEYIGRQYAPEHLGRPMLVFACTDDAALNARIADDARAAGAIVNCVDQPEDCDFFVPAVTGDGDVVVAIGTGGAAPALAGRLKHVCADALPERIGEFAELLLSMRDKVKSGVDDIARRGEILKHLASDQSYQAFRTGGAAAMETILDKLLTDSRS